MNRNDNAEKVPNWAWFKRATKNVQLEILRSRIYNRTKKGDKSKNRNYGINSVIYDHFLNLETSYQKNRKSSSNKAVESTEGNISARINQAIEAYLETKEVALRALNTADGSPLSDIELLWLFGDEELMPDGFQITYDQALTREQFLAIEDTMTKESG